MDCKKKAESRNEKTREHEEAKEGCAERAAFCLCSGWARKWRARPCYKQQNQKEKMR